MGTPRAYVRLTEPAVSDLRRLLKRDPPILRAVLKKLLLLERDPYAGEPLVGALAGWRRLVVGDRHWRIIWRVTSDDSGAAVIEVAEIWAVGAREDAQVYREMQSRVRSMPAGPTTAALAEVARALGRPDWRIAPAPEPDSDPVPEWLVERLVTTAGFPREHVVAMSLQQAVDAWTAYRSQPE